MIRRALLFAIPLIAVGADQPSAREIVERSIAKDQSNWAAAKNYTMVERKVSREFDESGKVRSVTSETRDWTFVEGEPFRRLIARNDQPLPPAEQKREDERLRKIADERRTEDAARKQRRLAEAEKRRQKGRDLLREIPRAYDFRLLGDDKVDGRDAWVIEATPRADFKPSVQNAWILSKFRGKIWIDKQDYEWSKVDCESIDTVRIGLFVARLNKGAHVMFEQTRVNDEVWLTRHSIVRFDARLLVKRANREEEQTFSNFKKFSADSRIVSVRQQ
jgi:hypothetical protein